MSADNQDQINQEFPRLSLGEAIRHLWNKTAFELKENELKSLSSLNEDVDNEFSNLVKTIEGVGCLLMNDKESGDFQDAKSVSALLLSLSNQVDLLHNLAWISRDAQGMLDYKADKK